MAVIESSSWDLLEVAARIGGFEEELKKVRRYFYSNDERNTDPVPGGLWVDVQARAAHAARAHGHWMAEIYDPIEAATRHLAGLADPAIYEGSGLLAKTIADRQKNDHSAEASYSTLLRDAATNMEQLPRRMYDTVVGISFDGSPLEEALQEGTRNTLWAGEAPEKVVQSLRDTSGVILRFKVADYLAGKALQPPWELVQEELATIKPSLNLL